MICLQILIEAPMYWGLASQPWCLTLSWQTLHKHWWLKLRQQAGGAWLHRTFLLGLRPDSSQSLALPGRHALPTSHLLLPHTLIFFPLPAELGDCWSLPVLPHFLYWEVLLCLLPKLSWRVTFVHMKFSLIPFTLSIPLPQKSADAVWRIIICSGTKCWDGSAVKSVHATLAEDSRSVPSTHVRWFTAT